MRKPRTLMLVVIALLASIVGVNAQQMPHRAVPIARPASTPTPSPTAAAGLRSFPTPRSSNSPAASDDVVPHPPPPPRTRGRKASGAVRFVHSATGADIVITYGAGCNGSSYPAVVPLNCQITWHPIGLPANSSDCYYTPRTNAAVAADGSSQCKNASAGGTYSLTLSSVGTYILGDFNKSANVWNELVYITAGTPVRVGTFATNAYSTMQSTFTASGSTIVYLQASGLTSGDHYVFDINYASLGGTCAYELGGIAYDGNRLCDPYAVPGIVASGGTLSATWTPPSGTATGTYILAVTDIDAGYRVGSRQFAIVSVAAAPTITFVPGGGNPSPAPAFTTPPTTDLGTFAYDGSDKATSAITIKTTGTPLNASSTYIRTFSDPNGVINTNFGIPTSATTDASGKIADTTATFSSAQTPTNFSTNTYTYSLLGPTASGPIVYSRSFQIVGYSMLTQFLNPQGTALTVGSGTATSGVQFSNTSDQIYGAGLGDVIQYIEIKTAGDGSSISLNCGSLCTSETVSDSAGNLWTATVTTAGLVYRLFLSPQGNALSVNGTLTVPNMTWTGPGIGCGIAGCKLTTSFVPQHGVSWTDTTKLISNPVYLVDNGASSPSATGSIVVVGNEGHGYTTRSTQAFYEYTEPFAQTQKLTLKYSLTDVNSAGSNIKNFRLTMPVGFLYSTMTVTGGGTAAWSSDAASCAGFSSNVFCFQSGAGIAAGVSDSVTFTVDSPKLAFSYTDVLGQVTVPGNFAITAANSPTQKTVEVGSTNPQLVDTTALGSYSLDPSLMNLAVSSTGANPYTMTFNFQNVSSVADPFPDYVDAAVLQVISGQGTFSALSTNNAAFTYFGPVSTTGGTDNYWFGVCAAQRASGQPQLGNVTTCTSAQEQNSIAPGGSITFNTTYTDASGLPTAILWVHGANSNGWTGAYTSLPLSGTNAYAGFQALGTYGAPPTLPSGTHPQVGLDTDATFGNSYVYRFNNQSGTNVYEFSMQIPGTDTSGANATDTETTPVTWTLTNTPTFASTGSSGTNYGCVVNTSSSATTGGAPGGILITGCTIPTGGYVDVAFAMKGPYNAGDSYKFGSQYTTKAVKHCATTAPYPCLNNGATTEQWTGDQTLSTILAANLSIVVNPGTITGSNPVVVCTGCTFGANLIDFGTIAADNATHTYSDVVRLDLTTNAASPEGWKIYESAATNPTNASGTPTNELQSLLDATHSNPVGAPLTYTTATTVLPTTGNGALMVQTAGTTAQRTAFNMINSFVVNVAPGDATGPRAPIVTYLFIAN